MAILKGVSPLLLLLPAIVSAFTCPPTGPLLPIPSGLTSKHPLISEMARNLTATIQAGIVAFNDTQTSFSLQITDLEKDLYSFHHTALEMGDGATKKVTGNTGYRIASISKVITTLATMLQGVCMDDPVTKYVPELKKSGGANPGGVDWSQVTLKALSSHLGGLGRDWATFDLMDQPAVPPAEFLGLPPVASSERAPCGKTGADVICTRKQFFAGMKNRTAVYYPNDRATYSNIGFSILGYAIESMTGMTYEEVIQKEIFKPLGMRHSTTKLPKNGTGAIPALPNDWFYEGGHVDAAGGIYSTSNDLSKFMRGVMTSKLMSPHETRGWYKPTAFTSSLQTAYGAPWEIYRTDSTSGVTSDGRIIDIITKSGGLTAYYSRILMIPELGFGITVLVAGNYSPLDALINVALESTIPVFDKIAKEQADKLYSGMYTVTEEDNKLNTTVEIALDDGPGLKITSMISRDVDLLEALAAIVGGGLEGSIDARLFAQDITKKNGDTHFNMGFEFVPTESQEESNTKTETSASKRFKKRSAMPMPFNAMSNDFLSTSRKGAIFNTPLCFGDVDVLPWGGKPLTQFVFKREGGKKSGKVEGVELVGFRVSLEKVE